MAWLSWEVTAVDFSPVAVERGRRLAAAHEVEVTWVVDDVATVEPPEGLDLVVVTYLHVAPDVLHAALGRAARALRLGGTVVVVGWDRTNAEHSTGGPRPPELLYDLDELRAALSDLNVVTAERVPQHRTATALDALIRAVRR